MTSYCSKILPFAALFLAGATSWAHGVGRGADVDSSWTRYSAVELNIEGNMLMAEEFWHEAERVWAYASRTRPKNRVAKFKRAICVSEIGEDWSLAKSLLDEVTRGGLTLRYDPFNPNQAIPPVDAWLWLANAEHRLGEFDLARGHVEAFLNKAGDKHGSMEWASKILAEVRFAELELASPSNAVISAMAINSDGNETHPVLTADGKTMFFSSDRARSNGSNHGRVDPNTKTHYFDIYRTQLQADSTWEEPEFLNLGVRHHANVVGSDAFGQKLIVSDDDGWTHELKTTEQWERGWTVAEPLFLDRKIPTEGEIVFFPNKDRLIASVKSRRGEGGYDLFESSLDDKGRWGKLKSLGTRVNTWGDEIAPFVAADGQTVFFASNGLESMGGFDLYRTTTNAAGGWTEPEHLGAPINSVNDDVAFVIGAKGEVGYLTSRREADRGDLQLYEVQMNGRAALEQSVVVLTLDAENLEGMTQPDVLVVKDAASGELVQRVERENTRNAFNLILPVGRDFVVESEVGTSSETAEPGIRRTLTLSQDLEAEVIELGFDEVFQSSEESEMLDAGALEPFVVSVVQQDLAEGQTTESDMETEALADAKTATSAAEGPTDAPGEDTTEAEALAKNGVTATQPLGQSSVNASKPNSEALFQESSPLAPMALAEVNAGEMLLAIQLYSGQVHTGRMDLAPALEYIASKASQGKPVIRIEGSASDGPSTRAGGNMELASSRAMDVYLRLVIGLAERGLEQGDDYEVSVVRRVQPDGQTPSSFADRDAHPASFQYVRMDVAVR